MKDIVVVKDKVFETYMLETELENIVSNVAKKISNDLRNENPLFLATLNGSFIFASDLIRKIDFDAEISFIKLASYSGTESTGNVKQLRGLNENIENRIVVVIEDIVDTGISMEAMIEELQKHNPKKIVLCTLLFKPGKFVKDYAIDYIGKSIDDDFIVGYGLDYEGFGRNLSKIYKIKE